MISALINSSFSLLQGIGQLKKAYTGTNQLGVMTISVSGITDVYSLF